MLGTKKKAEAATLILEHLVFRLVLITPGGGMAGLPWAVEPSSSNSTYSLLFLLKSLSHIILAFGLAGGKK